MVPAVQELSLRINGAELLEFVRRATKVAKCLGIGISDRIRGWPSGRFVGDGGKLKLWGWAHVLFGWVWGMYFRCLYQSCGTDRKGMPAIYSESSTLFFTGLQVAAGRIYICSTAQRKTYLSVPILRAVRHRHTQREREGWPWLSGCGLLHGPDMKGVNDVSITDEQQNFLFGLSFVGRSPEKPQRRRLALCILRPG